MKRVDLLRRKLKCGEVYRRADLVKWSSSVDRHLNELMESGDLEKLSIGLYYVPKLSVFGKVPADVNKLIGSFLKGNHFVVISPNEYNSLGLGTTQLYNIRLVYNLKRHGDYKLGNRFFRFVRKTYIPERVTKEFLFVDFVNNLKNLHEDESALLLRVKEKVKVMDKVVLSGLVSKFGTVATRKLFGSLLK